MAAIPSLIFESKSLIVLNKPTCLHSTRLGDDDEKNSVAAWLENNFPETIDASPNISDSGLINRLDFETSGILLVARTRVDWNRLHQMLLGGGLKKRYLGILDGESLLPTEVRGFIGNRYRGSKKVTVKSQEFPRSLAAVTSFLSSESIDKNTNITLIEASPARRHQVRAHAEFLGHSFVGDILYGGRTDGISIYCTKSAPPFFLHALYCSFVLDDKQLKFIAPIPDYGFNALIMGKIESLSQASASKT